MLSVEIIASGSELTSGDRLNTNAQWLSLHLADLGFQPRWHSTVGDLYHDNVHAVKIACERADFVVMTGGLGPTQDDLTREVFAEVGAAELEFRPELMEHISNVFSIRGVDMPERNRVQAFMPKGSVALTNPLGTAPGIWMLAGGKPIVALPGVPREMTRMWADSVTGLIQKHFGPQGRVIKRKINLFGFGESAVEAKILDLTARDKIPEVGITASEGMISLRITARSHNEEVSLAQIESVGKILYERLGEAIFSEGDVSLTEAVLNRCLLTEQSVAVIEIATGGLLSQRLFSKSATKSATESEVKIVSSTFGSIEDAGKALGLDQSTEVSAEILVAAVPLATGCSVSLFLQLLTSPPEVLASAVSKPALESFEAIFAFHFEGRSESGTYRGVGSRKEIVGRAANFALALALKSLHTG